MYILNIILPSRRSSLNGHGEFEKTAYIFIVWPGEPQDGVRNTKFPFLYIGSLGPPTFGVLKHKIQ